MFKFHVLRFGTTILNLPNLKIFISNSDSVMQKIIENNYYLVHV